MNKETLPAQGPVDVNVRGGDKKHLTKKQKRMKKAVAWLAEYMRSYDKQACYMDYEDRTFIDDVLYGLGVALHGSDVSYATGYEKWKQMLRDHLRQAPNAKSQATDAALSRQVACTDGLAGTTTEDTK